MSDLNNLKNLYTNFSDQNQKLEDFITQNRTSFNNLSNQLKNVLHDMLQLKNDTDKTIQEIEMGIERNQNQLTRLVSGANTKLMQEQIVQKRLLLTEQVQKINDGFTQVSREMETALNDFGVSSQQIVTDFKSTENQLQALSKANQAVEQLPPADIYAPIHNSLNQAIEALNSVRQGLEQGKVFNEINKSIENILQ